MYYKSSTAVRNFAQGFYTQVPEMRAIARQFSSISKRKPGVPLITFDKATIYPLGETVSPYFTDLTWKIREFETWAVVGPSSSGRRVLLEVPPTPSTRSLALQMTNQ